MTKPLNTIPPSNTPKIPTTLTFLSSKLTCQCPFFPWIISCDNRLRVTCTRLKATWPTKPRPSIECYQYKP